MKQKPEVWRFLKGVFLTLGTLCLLLAAPTPSNGQYTGPPEQENQRLFTKHFQKTMFDITEHALYSVEVLPNDEEYPIGKNTIGVVVHNDKDEDVKGAKLSITCTNMETGKSIHPTGIVDKKNGLYIVSGLDNISSPGHWELRVTVNKGGVKDSVKFKLPEALMKPYPKGRYHP